LDEVKRLFLSISDIRDISLLFIDKGIELCKKSTLEAFIIVPFLNFERIALASDSDIFF